MPKGRPRKSVQELKLTGMYDKRSSHKDYNEEVPEVITEDLKPPVGYCGRTKSSWEVFFKCKTQQGVLSREDYGAIIMMFDAMDFYFRTSDKAKELFRTMDVHDQEQILLYDKYVRWMKSSWETYSRIACEFGITPAQRSKLQVKKEKPQSELQMLLKKVQ